jgi:hypothetical protein
MQYRRESKMRSSFAFIMDKHDDFNNLIKDTSDFFDVKCNKITEDYVSAIDNKSNLILNITKKKINFIVTYSDEDEFTKRIDLIEKYLSEVFNDKSLGVRYYNECDDLFDEIENVNLMKI